jgi:hypothetical protein
VQNVAETTAFCDLMHVTRDLIATMKRLLAHEIALAEQRAR